MSEQDRKVTHRRESESAPEAGATTDFGATRVAVDEKAARVAGVFRSVAPRYDLMNDLMSFGSHRLMKRMVVELAAVRPGHRVLDLAGGTGDLAALLAPHVLPDGRITLADLNSAMLTRGRDRLLDAGLANIDAILADAERLPFADGSFDCLTIGFGLRNVTRKEQALREMYRVLAPGGKCLILEFAKPDNPLVAGAYEIYSSFWPLAGQIVAGDADAYRYLNESIRRHPSQAALKVMMDDAGFAQTRWHDLAGGIVAIHRGIRP